MGFSRQEHWSRWPFSRGSSWPRNWTLVYCTAGRFFTVRATRSSKQTRDLIQSHEAWQQTVDVQWEFSKENPLPTSVTEHTDLPANSGCFSWGSYLNAAAAKLLQLCPTLCDPIDGSLPGSRVPGILQARILELVAISFSNAWKWKVKVNLLSHVQLFATLWTVAHQAPLSMGFSRQEYWSWLPCSPPGNLPDPGVKPKTLLHWQACSLPLAPSGKPIPQNKYLSIYLYLYIWALSIENPNTGYRIHGILKALSTENIYTEQKKDSII